MTLRFGIFSLKDDLHALAVQHALQPGFGVDCQVVETDDLANTGGLTWAAGGHQSPALLRARGGAWIDVAELDLIWWRRANHPQREPHSPWEDADRDRPDGDPDTRQLISGEWNYALIGMLTTSFSGVWVNDPGRVRAAENKLIQLRAADQAGLRLPRTLVSQDPDTVRAFCAQLAERGDGVIAKAVRGQSDRPLKTVRLDAAALTDDSIRLCPTVYQELITGVRHVRICCFGRRVLAFVLETPDLDWRGRLKDVSCVPVELPEAIECALQAVLARLGISMAIMDGKFDDGGEFVWFEANPQGQFLFLEGMSGVDLTSPFCEFLLEQAHRVVPT